MKDLLLCSFAFCVLFIDPTLAQSIRWNNAPNTGLVFEISNDEAEQLLTRPRPEIIIQSMLHTRVDTFNIANGWTIRPDKGHFVLARVIENKLHCEYTNVFPYQVLLLKAYNALSLQILDAEGNVRADAIVKFRARRIRFDRESKTYRIENQWFNQASKIVTVEMDGFRSVFNVEKHEVPYWSDNHYGKDEGPDFYSYMITDKNRYKPGERVRFKSYALSGSRNPIRRDLEVWLIRRGKPLHMGNIAPHRPGSFAGEIVLHDSLKLTLDTYYTLQLWEKNGRVVSNCTFKYEDYELHGNRLHVELETPEQYHPASNYVSITATSENGLMLKDARATVVVLTENIREVFQPVVSLPDTLMFMEIPLDGGEATVVEIPSSLFSKSNTSYFVQVSVLNSHNQRMEQTVKASHFFSQYELTATFSNDSIIYQVMNNGVAMSHVPATVYRDGEMQGSDIVLPFKEKVNSATETVRFQTDVVSRTISFAEMLPRIEFAGGIKRDSFNISVNNPQQVQLSWYIYQGSQLLEKGFGTELDFKSLIVNRNETYYAELLYSFGGSDHIASKGFVFREGALDISLEIPDRVYPGQKIDATIEVTDEEGLPVSGVDLTALSTTAKLNYFLPDLPYYGSTSYARPDRATYTKQAVNKQIAILDLDYEKWARLLRLDTMRYYQMIYPGDHMFSYQSDIADSTQFALYVMQEGEAKTVYVIEVDRNPVYYSWTNQPKAYSFYVQPEKKKQITLRLLDRVLILDSLCFDRGKKTVLSIDLDRLPNYVQVHKITPEIVRRSWRWKYRRWVFTRTERERHHRYLASFNGTHYPAYLFSQDAFVPVSAGGNVGQRLVVGPIDPGMQTYTESEQVNTSYRHAGGFAYSFEDNIVYKMDPPALLPEWLTDGSFHPSSFVNDMAINRERLLEQKAVVRPRWHPRVIDLADHACRLKVMLPAETAKSGVASVLFQDTSDATVMSPCRVITSASGYFTVPRGLHNIIIVYNNASYLKLDSIELRSYSNIVTDLTASILHPADSLSQAWLTIVGDNCFTSVTAPSRTFDFVVPRHQTGNVQGVIFDDMNMPLPGATVVVNGTTIGAVTDVNGRFFIDVPEDPSTLVVRFIGFKSREIVVRPGSELSIVLEADIAQLQEVVVVGYGMESRKEMTGAISIRGMASLSGRVAGVAISQQAVDTDFESDDVRSAIPEPDGGQALYEEMLTLQTIRSDFSDVGFWEPLLFTDRNGKSTFTVTFPDDITRWDAVVYGMNRHLQTGTARKNIKSYKPLMAELHVPRFLTVGDSADFLGKVLNYTTDTTIHGSTTWAGTTTAQTDVAFGSFHTQKHRVVATSSDTLTIRYSFARNDGYFDGEERKVPVIEQGTLRANGSLATLKNGDVMHIKPANGDRITVEIFDNQLDVYARDVRYLLHYKYDCNEQLASKLIGFLNHRLIMQYEGKPFRYDKDVNRIIQRLLRNQNKDFLWSWWDVSTNTSYWMSAHILQALRAAKDAGYSVNLNLENVVRKATYKWDFLQDLPLSDLSLVHALAVWDVKIDYGRYVRQLDRQIQINDSVGRETMRWYPNTGFSFLNEKLMLLELRQLQNLPFVQDSLLRYKKQTILNEIYFSDGQRPRYWHAGNVSTNAIAYRIIKRDSTLSEMTTAMQMYFLSLRRKGSWNTYEAANVLMSILPDLIAQGGSKTVQASVSLNGRANGLVTRFPYTAEVTGGEELRLRLESGLPLYVMQYVEERVTREHAGTDAFRINTTFDESTLKAGKPTILKATVDVKRDAKLEHVMIEIPIPGGCSYDEKYQFDNAIETHREYFKDRTVIFCEHMTAGKYVFQILLLPRFTGTYHVNPAQVSLMYFPVINANNAITRVNIID